MSGIDPAEVAAQIMGWCKEGRNPAGAVCTRHMSVGWPCEKADAAIEIIRAALEQAWLEGYTAAAKQHPDLTFMGARNPYAKGGKS